MDLQPFTSATLLCPVVLGPWTLNFVAFRRSRQVSVQGRNLDTPSVERLWPSMLITNDTYKERIRGEFAARLKSSHASSSQNAKNDDGNLSPEAFLSNEVSSRQIETHFSRPKSRTPNSFILGDPDFPKKAPLLKFKNTDAKSFNQGKQGHGLRNLIIHVCETETPTSKTNINIPNPQPWTYEKELAPPILFLC